MRGRWVIVLLLSILLIVMTGCGDKGTGGKEAGKPETTTFELKLGHVGPADPEHPWEKYALKYADLVAKETNNRVKIKTYPASQLGADRAMTESLQQGTLEMGLISTIAMNNFVPELGLWDLPYIFPQDNAVVDKILEGPIGSKLAEAADKKGLVILAYWENDWRNLSNNVRPITKPEDLKGLKMRIVENQPSLDWFKRLGALPTPMAFSEVYTALQQKVIDGQDNGCVLTYGSKFYEVQKYYTISHHIYCPLAVVVSKKTWDKLPQDLKETMKKLAIEVGREQRQYNRQKAEEYLTKMEQAGVQVIRQLSPESLKQFQESAQPTYEAMAGIVGKDMINEMLKYREAKAQ